MPTGGNTARWSGRWGRSGDGREQIAEILKEMGQVELGGLATASREVVRTGDAGVQLMLGLANGIPSHPVAVRLTLAQAKASTVSAMNRLR